MAPFFSQDLWVNSGTVPDIQGYLETQSLNEKYLKSLGLETAWKSRSTSGQHMQKADGFGEFGTGDHW